MAAPKRIARIKFGLLSPKEIRKMSVAKIITADTYDDDGFPIEMGLMDQRLGVIDPGLRCKTCGGRPGECTGHFGHIELVAPVTNVGYARLIKKFLVSICRKCGRALLEEGDRNGLLESIGEMKMLKMPVDDVVDDVFEQGKKTSVCPYCGEEQQDIKFEKPCTYRENGHKLTPTDIRERLERIPDEDLDLFGLDTENARPEWMIITALPVPPVTVRPSITLESGQRSEDDLTHKLVDIIRINQRFQENREAGAPQLIIEDLWELLQYHITTYLNNAVSGVPSARHRSGRPLKTLSQRLKGKEGRFRGNLSGKRVNFSARTVISPDPNLNINEVGVPEPVARELSVPITVNDRNIKEIKKNIRSGLTHPGINYVKRSDGRRIKLSERNCEELAEQLEVGWVVDRQLKDGDTVLFNRQPSLHRMSIMAHNVKVMPGKTFRISPAICPPYNADFDGDEMNMHALQTEEARAESAILMEAHRNILSPRFGGPIIGGIHDHVSGLFLLTWTERRFNAHTTLDLLRKTDIRKLPKAAGHEEDEPYWTGKQIFSQILPENTNLTFRAKICRNCEACKESECENDAYVTIRKGNLLSGAIDENAVGAFKGKVLDMVIKECGYERARQFVDDFTRLAVRSITRTGFSFGINDEDIPPEAQEEIHDMIEEIEKKIDRLVEAFEAGDLEPMPGRSLEETLEMKIMQELGRARDRSGSIAERYLGMSNSGVIMALSGARGSMLNLTQMAACVGQQSVRGERITRGYTDRTLPHFRHDDLGADAHGFVKSSYKRGLTPLEFFFHAIGGREGLVDTAVRTSRSGYFQRRLINALEDLEVKYDGTVRDTRGMIVQFEYGEDSVDPSKSDYGRPVNIQRIIQDVVGGSIVES